VPSDFPGPLGGATLTRVTHAPDLAEDCAAELAGLLLSTQSFEELLQGIAGLAVRTVPAAVSASITLAEQGRAVTVASADPLAARLDEHQYAQDAGPCLDALETGTIVDCDDLGDEARWDGFAAEASRCGVLAVLATPLVARDAAVGVLNLYGGIAGAFRHPRDRRLAQMLASHATVAVTAALRHYDEVTLSDHLRVALASRSVIDQAMGVLMARNRCPSDEAFRLLRAMSQRRNTKLRDVAAEVVASVAGPSGIPDRDRRA